MSGELRQTGLELIGDVPWGTHFCQFYQTAQDLLDILVPYFVAGLKSNEFCMWVTSEPLGVDAARGALRAALSDFEDRVSRGQIEIVPHTEWYLKGGTFDSERVLNDWIRKLDGALAAGFEGLRLTGNTLWLEPKDWRAFTDYEAAVDGVIGRYRMLAVCTYSLDRCGFDEILDVIRNHRFALVRREGRWELVESAERRRAEESLRESEEKYRVLFENMAEGFALYELVDDDEGRPIDWRVLEVNNAYTRHTGIPRERIVGRRIGEVFPGAIEDYLSIFDRVVSTGIPESFETFARAVGRYQHVFSFPAGGRRFASTIEDITARKLAEDGLRASEERFRSLFNNMTEGFAVHEIVTDEAGRPIDYRFLDINLAFEKLTGLRRGDVIGKRVREVLPGIEPFWIETYGRVALEGEPASFERYYPAPLDRWYDIFAYKSAPRQFAVIFRDVSRRKRAEESLRQSEERFRVIASSTPDHLLVQDRELRYTLVLNPQLGLTEKDMIGKTDHEILAKEDAEKLTTLKRTVLKTGEPMHVETSLISRDGRPEYFDGSYVPKFDAQGRVDGLIGYFRNVTDRKKTEALRQALAEQEKLRLGAAVEQASDAVIIIDLDGTIRYVNAAFEAINHVPRDGAVGRSYFDILGGDPAAAQVNEALIAGRVWHGHLTRHVAESKPVDLEVTVSPATDPTGLAIGGLITEKDVTLENILQRQVRQSQKMEALGTLAGGISHDFNNLLGVIILNTEMALLDLAEPSHARRYLPTVLQAANRGKDLVKQIITFSRQREWERGPLDVTPVAKEAIRFLRSSLPKDVTIHETIAADCGAILGDPSQFHQVIINLSQNAALAMAEGGGDLEIRLEPVKVDAAMIARHPDLKPGAYVRLTVADTGCGMSKEVMERIFEPFFTTRAPGAGSGLGLAVVHGIVRNSDGAIIVYSEPGKGSVFSVYFPRLQEGAPVPGRPKPLLPIRGRERVLVVDDEESQRTSLANGLKRLGFRVTARAGGRSALTVFRKNPSAFDVVITDQTMPRMSGLELAAALDKVRPDIPVILCTGFSEKVNGAMVGQHGIREFVMKPFTLRQISELINKAVKKPGGVG
jgi:PAS domain S-box-containing protein